MNKAQTSLEISVLLGAMLIILIIFIAINLDMTGLFVTTNSRNRISIALDDIVNTAETVFLQGSGARSRVLISLPANIYNASIENSTITFEIFSRFGGTVVPIYRIIDFNITGELPVTSGNHWVFIESFGRHVNVSLS